MDALLVIAVILSLYFAFRRIGWWRWFWGGLALYLGIFELTAKLTTGMTISQQYWKWSEGSAWWWLPALLVALGGIGLAVHLAWQRLSAWWDWKNQDDRG